MPNLWLASQSPRRAELLHQIKVCHQVIRVNVPETRCADESPVTYVQRLALSKSQAGVLAADDGVPVLGADTIVVLGQQVLEKPKDKPDFLRMLNLLSDNTHQVMTAVAVSQCAQSDVLHCVTEVQFGPINDCMAEKYWALGEPVDKAGGYGIQGLGAAFVAHINGSYSNVVGLPLYETAQLLERFGVPVWGDE